LLKTQLLKRFLGISTGGNGKVPWTALGKSQVDYIKGKYLPKGLTLKQYYHLRQEDIDAILKHCEKRQAASKVPFSFKEAIKDAWKNKRTSEKTDANAGMSPSEETEGDLQYDQASQVSENEAPEGDGSSDSPPEQAFPGRSMGNAADDPNRVR
jgi:hypothetical protein